MPQLSIMGEFHYYRFIHLIHLYIKLLSLQVKYIHLSLSVLFNCSKLDFLVKLTGKPVMNIVGRAILEKILRCSDEKFRCHGNH